MQYIISLSFHFLAVFKSVIIILAGIVTYFARRNGQISGLKQIVAH